jgi:serine/threonine protein phosphatase 1
MTEEPDAGSPRFQFRPMDLPGSLDYPIVAVGDLHGQRDELERLVARLEALPEWPRCALVFLGDFVDRGPDVRGTVELVLELLQRPPGGSAVMGNHDLALVRAARLDDGPASPYWVNRYRACYDCRQTFESYLGRPPALQGPGWEDDLRAIREAMPEDHRRLLGSLPWAVEAPGHLFLHNGLSGELRAPVDVQVEGLRARRWDRERLQPAAGSDTERHWQDDYPVWLGADRKLAESPLAHPGKAQVTGHDRVGKPDVSGIRIRIDTSGGSGRLTGCLLRSDRAEPAFIGS